MTVGILIRRYIHPLPDDVFRVLDEQMGARVIAIGVVIRALVHA